MGRGDVHKQAPAIAGREAWYLEAQLRKFREGVRGAHPDDSAGKIMAPVSQTLQSADITHVAAYLAALETSNIELTLKNANIESGKKHFRACILCHGNRAQGKPILKAPALVGLNDWYIVAQLEKFKAGTRGSHDKDVEGASMRPFAQALPDKQAMIDVAAYIQTFE